MYSGYVKYWVGCPVFVLDSKDWNEFDKLRKSSKIGDATLSSGINIVYINLSTNESSYIDDIDGEYIVEPDNANVIGFIWLDEIRLRRELHHRYRLGNTLWLDTKPEIIDEGNSFNIGWLRFHPKSQVSNDTDDDHDEDTYDEDQHYYV